MPPKPTPTAEPTAEDIAAVVGGLLNVPGPAPAAAPAEPPAAVKVTRACRVNFSGVVIELEKDQVVDNHPELVRFLSDTGAPVEPA